MQLAQLGLEQLKEFCPIVDTDVYNHLGAKNVVKSYLTKGAAGTKNARKQITFWKRELVKR